MRGGPPAREAGKAGGPALAAPGNGRGGAAAAAADEDAPRETYELYAVLLAALRPGETLPAAIRRLKPAKAPPRACLGLVPHHPPQRTWQLASLRLNNP